MAAVITIAITVMSHADNLLPVSAPITEALAGKAALSAVKSVFRIIDIQRGIGGTGFLHKERPAHHGSSCGFEC